MPLTEAGKAQRSALCNGSEINSEKATVISQDFKEMHPHYEYGWQTSHGHKGQIFVDKKGEFSWTLLVFSCGHFCSLARSPLFE